MNRKNICAATAQRRAVKNLLFGVGSAVLALLCRWAMTDFAPPGQGTMVANRYTPFLFLFSAMFAILALWLFFQGLRDLIVPANSDVAKSVRDQLTPEELRLPLREQFALVDDDLAAHGKALAGGKVLIGQEWLFARDAELPAVRLANVSSLTYQQTKYGGMVLCVGRGGGSTFLEGVSTDEMEQVRNEIIARLSPRDR